jgi:cytochrome c oxidase subunit 2
MQELTWNITLVLILALAAVFLFVVARSGNGVDFVPIQDRANRLRVFYFWALVSAIFVATIVTLSGLPYPAGQPLKGEPQIVNATAFQWYWELSRKEVEPNRTVEFRVGGADVNHGFGLYDASLRLLAQTQAMPGYVNILRYTFTKPGTYQIMCLEYCGLGHHMMDTKVVVKTP